MITWRKTLLSSNVYGRATSTPRRGPVYAGLDALALSGVNPRANAELSNRVAQGGCSASFYYLFLLKGKETNRTKAPSASIHAGFGLDASKTHRRCLSMRVIGAWASGLRPIPHPFAVKNVPSLDQLSRGYLA